MDTSMLLQLAIILLVGWMIYKQFAPVKGVRTIRPDEFEQERKTKSNITLIDVREAHEYKSGHIPGAHNIPLSRLKMHLGDIPKHQPVFLYCQSGMRSRRAAVILAKRGVTNITNLQGGIMAWHRRSQ